MRSATRPRTERPVVMRTQASTQPAAISGARTWVPHSAMVGESVAKRATANPATQTAPVVPSSTAAGRAVRRTANMTTPMTA